MRAGLIAHRRGVVKNPLSANGGVGFVGSYSYFDIIVPGFGKPQLM